MPLSDEIIRQKPLSGPELLEVVLADTRDLLARDGMFAPHIGYGRVSYRVRVELEMDNLTYPSHKTLRESKAGGPGAEPKPQVEAHPLKKATKASVALDKERTRKMESPNATRIANDLPIQVQMVSQGKLVTRDLQYEKEGLPPLPEPVDVDRSKEAFGALQARVAEGPQAGGE